LFVDVVIMVFAYVEEDLVVVVVKGRFLLSEQRELNYCYI
jgi:hypothetical protein